MVKPEPLSVDSAFCHDGRSVLCASVCGGVGLAVAPLGWNNEGREEGRKELQVKNLFHS